jgi:hypothetical protein
VAEFVQQQGFNNVEKSSCAAKYSALMFQPRLIGVFLAAGLLLQKADPFLALAAVLLWNAAVPPLNPFDALYNLLIARPRRLQPLGPAPPPRRFAQALAGTVMLAIGLALLLRWQTAAWSLEALLTAEVATLPFTRFCPGTYLFHVLSGGAAGTVSTCQ